MRPLRAAEWARALGYSEAQFVRLALQEMVDEEGLDLETVFRLVSAGKWSRYWG